MSYATFTPATAFKALGVNIFQREEEDSDKQVERDALIIYFWRLFFFVFGRMFFCEDLGNVFTLAGEMGERKKEKLVRWCVVEMKGGKQKGTKRQRETENNDMLEQ